MPVTDPISDMLTVVRNGMMAHKGSVMVKRSKLSESVLEIFKREGFISNLKSIDDNKQGMIKVYMKGGKGKSAALTGIKRISKPGLRVYVKSTAIKKVYGGIGVALVSTSKGIMTDREAKEQKLGGEVLCHIW